MQKEFCDLINEPEQLALDLDFNNKEKSKVKINFTSTPN